MTSFLSARKTCLEIFPPSQSFFVSGSSRQSQLWSFFWIPQVVLGAVPVQHTCCLRRKGSWFDKVNVILGEFSRWIKTQNGAVETKKSSKTLGATHRTWVLFWYQIMVLGLRFFFSRGPMMSRKEHFTLSVPNRNGPRVLSPSVSLQ